MSLLQEINCTKWDTTYPLDQQAFFIKSLESGKILFLPALNFELMAHEKPLLSEQFIDAKNKNISYHKQTDRLQGVHCNNASHAHALKQMMRRFAQQATHLITQLLSPYKSALEMGRTSFRPVEIAGRVASSYRKDDTRLHVDAFPASPNQGKRILRVFSNINPDQSPRVWHVGETFETVAKRFLPTVRRPWPGRSALLKALKITRSYCTDYDYTMLQIHNNMKKDMDYQTQVQPERIAFSAGSSWIVQTDHVSHAALSGQHVLEQTFYLPVEAMSDPALSPLKTLERLMGRALT